MVLSHAHIDHSGNLPNLVKQGYSGPIFCTNATKDLTETMGRRLAEIATIGGLSAHAGQDALVEYAAEIKNSAEYIFLVYGEEKGVLPLKEKLKENRVKHVFYPTIHTSVEL